MLLYTNIMINKFFEVNVIEKKIPISLTVFFYYIVNDAIGPKCFISIKLTLLPFHPFRISLKKTMIYLLLFIY